MRMRAGSFRPPHRPCYSPLHELVQKRGSRSRALRRAWDDGRPDPYRAFENVGRAYLHFARSEPAYYSAMFEAGIPLDADPGLREAGERAFEVLRRASEALCAQAPSGMRPPALMMSLHVWALSHGIASLFARADAGRRALPVEPGELTEAGGLLFL